MASGPEKPEMSSSRPYLIRALYDWIVDNQLTPHVVADAAAPGVEAPPQAIQNGKITLNIAPDAVRDLVMGNEWVSFGARFSGTPRQVNLPVAAVMAVYARENGQGMIFPPEDGEGPGPGGPGPGAEPENGSGESDSGRRSHLKIVK